MVSYFHQSMRWEMKADDTPINSSIRNETAEFEKKADDALKNSDE